MDPMAKEEDHRVVLLREVGHDALVGMLIAATTRAEDAERMSQAQFEQGELLGKSRGVAVAAERLERAGFASAAAFLRGE